MQLEHHRLLVSAVTAAVVIALAPAPLRALEEKLDVYVNPLEFEHRIPPLAIGDPAPKLVVDRWIQGAPMSRLERGTVYVLEFWATWCQPCQKSLPQMDALAKRYGRRGVHVIGIAAAEENGPAKLEAFLERRRLSYPIAFRASNDMYEVWVRAAR